MTKWPVGSIKPHCSVCLRDPYKCQRVDIGESYPRSYSLPGLELNLSDLAEIESQDYGATHCLEAIEESVLDEHG